jgi:hypothetical protein
MGAKTAMEHKAAVARGGAVGSSAAAGMMAAMVATACSAVAVRVLTVGRSAAAGMMAAMVAMAFSAVGVRVLTVGRSAVAETMAAMEPNLQAPRHGALIGHRDGLASSDAAGAESSIVRLTAMTPDAQGPWSLGFFFPQALHTMIHGFARDQSIQ